MSTTFAPRACPDNAWKTWMKQGWELAWRGRSGWWAMQAVMLGIMAAVTLGGGLTLGLMVLAVPIWGIHLAVAECLASGRSSFPALAQAVVDDIRAHGRQYAIQALTRQAVYLLLTLLLSWMWPRTPPTPSPAVTLTTFQLVMIASQAWMLMWAFMHILWMQRWMGFEAQLSWKAPLPFLASRKLNDQALTMNRRSFFQLRLWMALTVVVGLFIPFALLVVEPFWAGVNRCAFADIFDQNPGLAEEKVAEESTGKLAALPM